MKQKKNKKKTTKQVKNIFSFYNKVLQDKKIMTGDIDSIFSELQNNKEIANYLNNFMELVKNPAFQDQMKNMFNPETLKSETQKIIEEMSKEDKE